jgi:hypothetical protein
MKLKGCADDEQGEFPIIKVLPPDSGGRGRRFTPPRPDQAFPYSFKKLASERGAG